MIKLLAAPFITDGSVEVVELTPVNNMVGTSLDVIKFAGYGLTFGLFVASIFFLIMFIVSKVKGSEKAKQNLIIFIVLISIAVLISLGATVLDIVWNAASSI